MRLRIPALADMAYTGAGCTFAVPAKRAPRKELSVRQRSLNRAHSRLRHPVERGVATVKRWRIFHHARCSPDRLTSAAKAVLTLELQTLKRLTVRPARVGRRGRCCPRPMRGVR
ncbi:transposase family protein [Streptomyces sp. NPDC097981]|uniref:transposase family protein n=1 Tax=Streptomyces sp. NPDC097981 TaxID=3155428 RepID=UPI00332CC97D